MNILSCMAFYRWLVVNSDVSIFFDNDAMDFCKLNQILSDPSYFQQQEASCHGNDSLQLDHVHSAQLSASARLGAFRARGKWNEVSFS